MAIDSVTGAEETTWLENVVSFNESDMWHAALHTPLDITGFRVGDPVILTDAYLVNFVGPWEIQSVALSWMDDTYRRGRGEQDDFHVAVITKRVAEAENVPYTVWGGGKADGLKLSAITLTQSSRNPDSRPNTVLGIDNALWHEIGHNMGMGHVYDGTSIRGPYENNYPVPGGRLLTDAHDVRPDGVLTVIANEHFDIMSYTYPSWLSAFTYRKMAEVQSGVKPTLAAFRRLRFSKHAPESFWVCSFGDP